MHTKKPNFKKEKKCREIGMKREVKRSSNRFSKQIGTAYGKQEGF